eukprot:TRINITY_DN8394_c0_g1_i1.p1 TRINITY_DN8394_c0_g1~~TRINITY_DN8394_c0_g1_i1.p1  ORF type:complete len:355 (-),score=94.92 TRINITY_DN8394_c0_g1_i1:3-1067(-)
MGLFDNTKLEKQVKELEAINADLREQIWDRRKEMDKMKEEFEARLLDYQKQLARSRAAAAASPSITFETEERARLDAQMCEDLSQRLQEAESKLAEASEWRLALEAEVQQQQLAALEAQTVVEQYRQAMERLRSENLSLSEEVQLLRQAVVAAKNEEAKRQLDERLQAEIRAADLLRAELSQACADRASLHADLDRASAEIADLRKSLELQEANAAQDPARLALEMQIDQLRSVLEVREAATQEVVASLEAEKAALEAENTKLKQGSEVGTSADVKVAELEKAVQSAYELYEQAQKTSETYKALLSQQERQHQALVADLKSQLLLVSNRGPQSARTQPAGDTLTTSPTESCPSD